MDIAGQTGGITAFALSAAAARPMHTPMMRHSHTSMPAPPALTPQSGFACARTPHPLWRARGRRSPRDPRRTCASSSAEPTATGQLDGRARCVLAARAQCSRTPRAFIFMYSPHLMKPYILRAGDAGVHARRGQWRSPTTWRRSLLITINGQMPREHRGRAARVQVRCAPRAPIGG